MTVHSIARFVMRKRLLPLAALAAFAAACTDTAQITQPEAAGPPLFAHAPAFGGTFAYVANFRSDNVTVIDVATNLQVALIPVGDGPLGIAITPLFTSVYTGRRSEP